MKKYTANYAHTNSNFVIQNLPEGDSSPAALPLFCVAQNLLQRGQPAIMSKFLQSRLGEIHKGGGYTERLLFAASQRPIWRNTIRGDEERGYFPAKDFFERIIPAEFGSYSFVQSLMLPEAEINDITGLISPRFVHQRVDFYLPVVRLVIEIDGQQHKMNDINRVSDQERDKHLESCGIAIIRIDTAALRDGSYRDKVGDILAHLELHNDALAYYEAAYRKSNNGGFSRSEVQTQLLPTAIIRFQVLLLELLSSGFLDLQRPWKFHILSHEDMPGFAELAAEDLLIWLDHLWRLQHKEAMTKPAVAIEVVTNRKMFRPRLGVTAVDFSLLQRYTDEDRTVPEVIFVRTDYFDRIKDRTYFRVRSAAPINYRITDEDKPALEFFLQNIFDKERFRDGQFPIIANALNRRDTVGLLPTGGGKSLCYQLPCLLQPSVNFVVCPIKSLMHDQYDNLTRLQITNVAAITSDASPEDRRRAELYFEQGRYLFVWISPEKLQILAFRKKISAIVTKYSIAYAVIDEVHCLSEWGHDFRTAYLNMAKTVDRLSPRDETGEGAIKFIGLTATASVNVLKDIRIEFSRQKGELENENIKSLLDYSRKELQFEVVNAGGNKHQTLLTHLNQLQEQEGWDTSDEKAALVFTPNVNGPYGCYGVSSNMNTVYPGKVSWFSGEVPRRNVVNNQGVKVGTEPIMSDEDFKKHKAVVQKKFKADKIRLLVATKSFGMGIDKQNIFYTFHYGLPSSVEALYQEAGRAGRWDKSREENKNKIGRCYVLHSPETCDEAKVARLFDQKTGFAEMKAIAEEVRFNGNDIFRQVFLFTQGQNDVDVDFEITRKLIDRYFEEDARVLIFWQDAYHELGVNHDVLEKAIYRLSLLGLVEDWTTNFIDHYEVQFRTCREKYIIQCLTSYIRKYKPGESVVEDLPKVQKATIMEKAIWYLLNWIFENIAYNRKQALKTLSEFCTAFKDDGSDGFKRHIDNYFRISETTFVIQHISEYPMDFAMWFELLGHRVILPERKKLEALRDGLSRFLESYRNNMGLNLCSGLVRLALNQYEDSDGRARFENALADIKSKFGQQDQIEILKRLEDWGETLPQDEKMEFCYSIARFYPHMLEELAESYDLMLLLSDVYAKNISQMKLLNQRMYEQLAEI
jgi:ATP-dependent DNA helicase RecQ